MKNEKDCNGLAFELLMSDTLSKEEIQSIINVVAEIIYCSMLRKEQLERNGEHDKK